MNVLVVGSGGREHALVWKIKQSNKVKNIFCIPGNAGIGEMAECTRIPIDDFEALTMFVQEKKIDLTVVGPEVPLVNGIVDYFEKKKLKIFGPCKKAAQLEGSKVFAKNFMKKYNIPTATYKSFTKIADATSYLESWPQDKPLVVKADGLAAGKGVIIRRYASEAQESLRTIMEKHAFGSAGDQVIIEEFLDGEEASVMVFMDGDHYSIMVSSQDHKRVYDNDQGPNTGGMGAYAPAPVVTQNMKNIIETKVIQPIIRGFQQENIEYKGVLYIGLMIVKGIPYVLEFNCRFGDPETQVVLPLLKSDLVAIMEKIIIKQLDKSEIEWYNKAAICVVLASQGYPSTYPKGLPITGLDTAGKLNNVTVFHAGTSQKEGSIVTSGGRVLGITGIGAMIQEAYDTAYSAIYTITFDGMHYRKDIAQRAFNRNEVPI